MIRIKNNLTILISTIFFSSYLFGQISSSDDKNLIISKECSKGNFSTSFRCFEGEKYCKTDSIAKSNNNVIIQITNDTLRTFELQYIDDLEYIIDSINQESIPLIFVIDLMRILEKNMLENYNEDSINFECLKYNTLREDNYQEIKSRDTSSFRFSNNLIDRPIDEQYLFLNFLKTHSRWTEAQPSEVIMETIFSNDLFDLIIFRMNQIPFFNAQFYFAIDYKGEENTELFSISTLDELISLISKIPLEFVPSDLTCYILNIFKSQIVGDQRELNKMNRLGKQNKKINCLVGVN